VLVEGVSVAVPDQVLVKVDWSEAEACPVAHSNQILAQLGAPSGRGVPDGIYLTFGHVLPPIVVGDEEQRAARVAELTASTVKVAVQGRVQISRETLTDVIKVLQTAAEQYDAAVAASKPQERV
jgi:hypothetical protein